MPNPATVREQRLRKTKAQLIDEIDMLEQCAGVRSHSAKRSLAELLIAKSARRSGEIAMQTAGSGPDSPSTAIFATLPVTASGHPGNLG